MRRDSWELGTWGGIPVSMHWTVLLSAAWLYIIFMDVVAMLVGHEDRIQIGRIEPHPREAYDGLLQREAAVDEHARGARAVAGFEQRGVASAAASQASKAHGQASRCARSVT